MSHPRGFTVWQLLGVCVLVLLVTAILFPAFEQFRQRDEYQICPSNEKQIGLALWQYAEDNDNQWPSGTQGRGLGWGGRVYPYIKFAAVYKCPNDQTPGGPQRPVVSYGLNVNAALHPSASHYPNPARTVLLFEVSGVAANVARPDEDASHGATVFSPAGDGTDGTLAAGHAPDRLYATGGIGGRPSASPTQFGDPRHHGMANYLFADGHVKALAPADVSGGSDAPSATAAQTGTIHGTAAGTGDGSYAATFSVK